MTTEEKLEKLVTSPLKPFHIRGVETATVTRDLFEMLIEVAVSFGQTYPNSRGWEDLDRLATKELESMS